MISLSSILYPLSSILYPLVFRSLDNSDARVLASQSVLKYCSDLPFTARPGQPGNYF